MTGAEAIPFEAWEQAVFVALFVVFGIGLLTWFGKQSDKWQKFMFDIDDKWRAFDREQREANNCAMEDVRKGLADLTQVTGKLVLTVDEMRTDIGSHDAQAKEILAAVKKPTPKPRAKKTVANDGQ